MVWLRVSGSISQNNQRHSSQSSLMRRDARSGFMCQAVFHTFQCTPLLQTDKSALEPDNRCATLSLTPDALGIGVIKYTQVFVAKEFSHNTTCVKIKQWSDED
ncbi:hypothetical protein J6590_096633, partial [Homalodisca vitripennis]